jgi:polyribonucleotide nucleotidyltransferase
MATVCGGSLALMDAGVPTSGAGGRCGHGPHHGGRQAAVLTDILGDEDHLGDMDFKVAGTTEGISACRWTSRSAASPRTSWAAPCSRPAKAACTSWARWPRPSGDPRGDISDYAPRITTIKIPVERIKDIIGPGGKIIRGIQMETGAKVDVEDDGTVHVAAVEAESGNRACR